MYLVKEKSQKLSTVVDGYAGLFLICQNYRNTISQFVSLLIKVDQSFKLQFRVQNISNLEIWQNVLLPATNIKRHQTNKRNALT